MRITRLGESVDRSGRLVRKALRRTMEVLSEYREVLVRFEVADVMATATSAVRDASNSADFLGEAAETIGTEVQRADGARGRAALVSRRHSRSLDPGEGPFLVVDVGGGSTELVTAAARAVPASAVGYSAVPDASARRRRGRLLAGGLRTADRAVPSRAIRRRPNRWRGGTTSWPAS